MLQHSRRRREVARVFVRLSLGSWSRGGEKPGPSSCTRVASAGEPYLQPVGEGGRRAKLPDLGQCISTRSSLIRIRNHPITAYQLRAATLLFAIASPRFGHECSLEGCSAPSSVHRTPGPPSLLEIRKTSIRCLASDNDGDKNALKPGSIQPCFTWGRHLTYDSLT